MTSVCSLCANENPPDHSFCHQCGSRLGVGPGRHREGTPQATFRRPPDESRLPPAGSFRSGLYRLIRSVFINQNSASVGSPVAFTTNGEAVGIVSRSSSGADGDSGLPDHPFQADYPFQADHPVQADDPVQVHDPAIVNAPDSEIAVRQGRRSGGTAETAETADGASPDWALPVDRAGSNGGNAGPAMRSASFWLSRALLLPHLLPGRAAPVPDQRDERP